MSEWEFVAMWTDREKARVSMEELAQGGTHSEGTRAVQMEIVILAMG